MNRETNSRVGYFDLATTNVSATLYFADPK
jgi:hypothetical protein